MKINFKILVGLIFTTMIIGTAITIYDIYSNQPNELSNNSEEFLLSSNKRILEKTDDANELEKLEQTEALNVEEDIKLNLDDSSNPRESDIIVQDVLNFDKSRPLSIHVLTWYSYEDNTPPNSNMSHKGEKLVPYISIAIPFRFLKKYGGYLNIGEILYVKFLDGRIMPNGYKHNGYVRIDDFCGDKNDDSYCFQNLKNKTYPNIDIYIGSWRSSGMKCGSGPAGSGQEITDVFLKDGPLGNWGGESKGPGRCGSVEDLKINKPACAIFYVPKYEKWWDSVCRKQ